MYNDNMGNNFISSTPVHKVKNKRFSNLSEEYITKKLMDYSTQIDSIMEQLNKCMKKRKKYEKLRIDVSIHKKDNSKTAYSLQSETTWSSKLSSIEKPRKLTLSEIDYTNSILNHSFVSSNSKNGNRDKSENVERENDVVKDDNDLTAVTDLSHHTSKKSKLADYNKLFSCEESILDIDAFNRENLEESSLRISELIDSQLNNTIDRKELGKLTFNSSVKSNEEMSRLSSFQSKDLLENRKFVETPKQTTSNNLYPFFNPDQFNPIGWNYVETLDVPVYKYGEKVYEWLENKKIDNKSNYNKSLLARKSTKENYVSISDSEDSVSSNIELNFKNESNKTVSEFNSICCMDLRKFYSENENNKEEDISKPKQTLKKYKLVVDNDEGNNKENENNFNNPRFVTNIMKDNIRSLSDPEDSVDSDLESNPEDENNETDNRFNSICSMDMTRFSSEYEYIEKEHISKPKETLKKNTLGDVNDERMFSGEIKDNLHSQNNYSRIKGTIVTSAKKKAIHEFNKSKYPIFENIDDDDDDGEHLTNENYINKFHNNKTRLEHSNSISRQSIINCRKMNECDNLNISSSERTARILKENEIVNSYYQHGNRKEINMLNNNCTCCGNSPRNYNFSTSYDNQNLNKRNNFDRYSNSDKNNTHMSNSENEIYTSNNRFQKFTASGNFINKTTCSEKSQIYRDSCDSRNIKEDKSFELSKISDYYDKIILLLKENGIMREFLSDYKDNVEYKKNEILELQSRLRHNTDEILKYQHLLESTKDSLNYNLVKAQRETDRLRDIIVEQQVIFINEYQPRQ